MSRIVGSFNRVTEARLVVEALQRVGITPQAIRVVASEVRGARPRPVAEGDDSLPMHAGDAATSDTEAGSSPAPGGVHAEAIDATPHRTYATADTTQAATDGAGLVGVRTDIDDLPGAIEATGATPVAALVVVEVDDADTSDACSSDVMRIMQQRGAIDINQRDETWRSGGWTGFDDSAKSYTVAELEREAAARDVETPRPAPGPHIR